MAHKTFISYKYSESRVLRDKIISRLGSDSRYYQGETSSSPDLTGYTNETIKENLKDMIFNTSVMIVIASPNMKQSKWMEWEIKYALRAQSRGNYTSRPNGIICVISKHPSLRAFNVSNDILYSWAYDYNGNLKREIFFDIILKNTDNRKSNCELYRFLNPNYILFVREDHFLYNPKEYIDKAYNLSLFSEYYDISKE